MSSDIAKLRFIADSVGNRKLGGWGSFRGSDDKEQEEIEMIRREFAPYLHDDNPPAAIVKRLIPTAKRLLSGVKWDGVKDDAKTEMLVGMYEVSR